MGEQKDRGWRKSRAGGRGTAGREPKAAGRGSEIGGQSLQIGGRRRGSEVKSRRSELGGRKLKLGNRSSRAAGSGKESGVAAAVAGARPRWDGRRKTLFFGSLVVKAFRRPAKAAELILQVFQEQGWPPRIDDPLPPLAGRREAERLRKEIYSLNRRLERPLIRFFMDGTGEGIRWEPK